jgi:hypothetical protein
MRRRGFLVEEGRLVSVVGKFEALGETTMYSGSMKGTGGISDGSGLKVEMPSALDGTLGRGVGFGVRSVPKVRTRSNSSVPLGLVARFLAISSRSSGERGSDISLRRLSLRVGPRRRARRSSPDAFVTKLAGRCCGVGRGVTGVDFGRLGEPTGVTSVSRSLAVDACRRNRAFMT